MAKSKEKELAAQLFIYTDMSQKDIACKINVTEASVSKWAKEEKWDELKLAKSTTNASTIAGLRILLQKQVERNKEKMETGEFAKADADTMLELARTIDSLEGTIPLRTYIQVMEEFMDSIPHDKAKFKTEVAELQMKFLLNRSRTS
jgi:uncharacterized protein YjcR